MAFGLILYSMVSGLVFVSLMEVKKSVLVVGTPSLLKWNGRGSIAFRMVMLSCSEPSSS